MPSQINYNSIFTKILKTPKVQNTAHDVAVKYTKERQQIAIDEFNNSVVTKEIEAGPGASNISGTLSGKGNLFSFIGFPASSNPIAIVLSVWNLVHVSNTSSKTVVRNKTGIIQFKVTIPTEDDFADVTPFEWASGRSWLLSVETGIPYLSYYIYRMGAGRSEGGTQVHNKVRDLEYRPVKYFQTIYEKFKLSLEV